MARAHLSRVDPLGVPTGSLQLPATKADLEATGVTRTHGCICGGGPVRASCPVHALWDQQLLLATLFRQRCRPAAPDMTLPLFPTASGKVASKAAQAETIKCAAQLLGTPLANSDGTQRITGHSLRTTGAQGLARLGLDVFSIELLGRWGSSCVRGYVRDASVTSAAARARSLTMTQAMDKLLAETAGAAAPIHSPHPQDEELRAALERIAPQSLLPWRVSLLAECKDMLARHQKVVSAPSIGSSVRSSSSSSSSSSRSSGSQALAAEGSPHSTAEGGTPFAQEVSSVWRRAEKRHVVAKGPPHHPPEEWVTVCGWHFGRPGRAVPPLSGHPLCAKFRKSSAAGLRGHLHASVVTDAPPAE